MTSRACAFPRFGHTEGAFTAQRQLEKDAYIRVCLGMSLEQSNPFTGAQDVEERRALGRQPNEQNFRLMLAVIDRRLSARHLDCHKRPILVPPRGSYQLKT